MATASSLDELNRLGAEQSVYDRTDAILRRHMRVVVRRFGRLRSECQREDDAWALMQLVFLCYSDAWDDYSRCLQEAYAAGYGAYLPSGGQLAAGSAFAAYSASYALPEGYRPRAEWERKRDRAYESLCAVVQGGGDRGQSVERSRNVWARQLRQGADDMTLRGSLDALSDAGVRRVRFVTQRDGRVCERCRSHDGRTYRLGSQPALPLHHNCRCFYAPVV